MKRIKVNKSLLLIKYLMITLHFTIVIPIITGFLNMGI